MPTFPPHPQPLSHQGRGEILHQKAVWLPSPHVGEGLGVRELSGDRIVI